MSHQRSTTKRTKSIVLLIIAVPMVWEAWQFFRDSDLIVNPWLARDYPLALSWFLKFLGIQVGQLLLSIAFLRASRLNFPLMIASVYLTVVSVIDLIMFFVNFNKTNYALLYNFAAIVTVFVAFNYEKVGPGWYGFIDWCCEWRFVIKQFFKSLKYKAMQFFKSLFIKKNKL